MQVTQTEQKFLKISSLFVVQVVLFLVSIKDYISSEDLKIP